MPCPHCKTDVIGFEDEHGKTWCKQCLCTLWDSQNREQPGYTPLKQCTPHERTIRQTFETFLENNG